MADTAVSDGIRRVRTPEGVAHFKLPLESPIGKGHLKAASTKDIGSATAKVVTRLKERDAQASPRAFDIPAVTSEVLATNPKTGPELDAIMDRHSRGHTPEHSGTQRQYDGFDTDTATPETLAEVSTAVAHAARFGDQTALPVKLDGLTREEAVNAVLKSGVNAPRLMDDDVTPEQYVEVLGRLNRALDDARDARDEHAAWEVNRANGRDPFKGYATDYKASNVDEMKPQQIIALTQSINDWLDYENSPNGHNGRTTEGAQPADFDMPAATNDILASGLNVPFLSQGIDGGDYEITDTEYAEIGRQLWTVLQAHPDTSDSPDSIDATVPPRNFSDLRGAELATTLAEAHTVLNEIFTGAESLDDDVARPSVIRDLVGRGINFPAYLDTRTSASTQAEIERLVREVAGSDPDD